MMKNTLKILCHPIFDGCYRFFIHWYHSQMKWNLFKNFKFTSWFGIQLWVSFFCNLCKFMLLHPCKATYMAYFWIVIWWKPETTEKVWCAFVIWILGRTNIFVSNIFFTNRLFTLIFCSNSWGNIFLLLCCMVKPC